MVFLKLSELCRKTKLSLYFGNGGGEDFSVEKITVDSREADGKSIFAPILGYRLNGADFVGDAYRRGCRVFLSETENGFKNDIAIIKTENIRKTVAELSKVVYDFDNTKTEIIAVTGTKGKTSTALYTAKILSSLGIECFSVGTLGVASGDGKILRKTKNTTPEATELFRILSDCQRKGAQVIILEVSSQALKDFRVYGLEFFATIFSSFGTDHIGESEHESFTDYARSKRSLFTDYKSEFRIFNADDKYFSYMAFGTEKRIKCGFSEGSEFEISEPKISEKGSRFLLDGVPVSIKSFSEYDIRNVSLALAAAVLYTGKSISELAPLISDFTLPGRLERHEVNGRIFVIDFAHNALSFLSVMKVVRRFCKGRIIAVFGSVGGRSRERRREIAEVSERYADFSIITSDDPEFESAKDICKDILSHFKDKSLCETVVDREKAILRAYELSGEGDYILLLGKGHEEKMKVMGREQAFSEREIIEKLKKQTKNAFMHKN